MANCKICSRPVLAGPVMHNDCLEKLITEAAEQFCDNYCRWPRTNADQMEAHCDSCPMEPLMQLAKQGGVQK
ncbi:MAG: hypothetical protein HFF62_06025 [Oscillospiraceae bacterium]|jgi:hypothetical protein|nr:hypothetical protein [Oscillospiraceae bacterium]